MKNIFAAVFIFVSTLVFSQQSVQQFTTFSFASTELVEEYPEFDFNNKEFQNLPIGELFSIYVEENLNVKNVQGTGKVTTLLSLELDEHKTLKNVSAIGANETFNKEAVRIFKKYQGNTMNFNHFKNLEAEILIPISIYL